MESTNQRCQRSYHIVGELFKKAALGITASFASFGCFSLVLSAHSTKIMVKVGARNFALSTSMLIVLFLATQALATGFSPRLTTVIISKHPSLPPHSLEVSGAFRLRQPPKAFLPASVVSLPRGGSTSPTSTQCIPCAIDGFFQSYPYASAFLTVAVESVLADLVAQFTEHRQEAAARRPAFRPRTLSAAAVAIHPRAGNLEPLTFRLDVKRSLSFLLYGGLYLGIFFQFVYRRIFPSIFGSDSGLFIALQKTACDLAVLAPFATLPISYLIKSMVGLYNSPITALRKYWSDVTEQDLLKTYWMVWGPVQTFMFIAIPSHYRVSFMAMVSFFWILAFSSIANSSSAAATADFV